MNICVGSNHVIDFIQSVYRSKRLHELNKIIFFALFSQKYTLNKEGEPAFLSLIRFIQLQVLRGRNDNKQEWCRNPKLQRNYNITFANVFEQGY